MKIKADLINKKIYKINVSYSKSDIEKMNNSSNFNNIEENPEKENISNLNEINIRNNNYDFIIPEKYIEIDKEDCKLLKLLNINGNHIAIYSNNKREITYQDGMRQVIYDDNHQIYYYKNGNMKQVFNNGKILFYDKKEQKFETLYENGIKIVKYKDGKIERILNDKENINNNIMMQNFNINSNEKNRHEINKKLERKKFIYNNKYKTIQK